MLLIPAINLTSFVIIRRVNTVDGARKNTVGVRSQQNTANTVDWGSGSQRDGHLNTKHPNPTFD